MRRPLTFVLSLLASSLVVIAAPTVTGTAGAAPRPVSTDLQQIPMSGVSAAGRRTAAVAEAGSRTPTMLSAALSTRPYSLFGVTWRVDRAVTDVEVFVRTRTGGTWRDWEAVEVNDDLPDAVGRDSAGGRRSGTVPVWAGPSDGVQVRVDRTAGAAPREVRIQLIDPGTSPADTVPATPRSSATAAATRPEFITRAQWGADESIRRGRPSYTGAVAVGFVHHTASSNDYSPGQAAAVMRGIYAYHVKSNGWSDIGYNYLVDRYGRAYEGRAGGIDSNVLGAHTAGFNSRSFAVSLIGDFSTVEPPAGTLDTLESILAWKLGAAYRDPLGRAELVSAGGGGTSRYPAGTRHTFDVISGHRDAGSTTCPGARTYARMGEIRTAVSRRLGTSHAEPVVDGRQYYRLGQRATLRLEARAATGTVWTGAVTSASGRVVKQVSGVGGDAVLTWDLQDDGEPVRAGTYLMRLSGTVDEDPARPLSRTVVVAAKTCRGAPLERARCRAELRRAGG